jgi:hypothetical protein
VLRDSGTERIRVGRPATTPRPVSLVFPGHRSQPARAALGLYHDVPAFAAALDGWLDLLESEDLPLRQCWSDPDSLGSTDAVVSRPLLFAVEAALARLWQDAGVRPATLLGQGNRGAGRRDGRGHADLDRRGLPRAGDGPRTARPSRWRRPRPGARSGDAGPREHPGLLRRYRPSDHTRGCRRSRLLATQLFAPEQSIGGGPGPLIAAGSDFVEAGPGRRGHRPHC